MMPRPPFEPTPEMERICSMGVAFGLTHEQISKLVGCDPKTLRKHFRNALETGKEKLTMAIGSQLYKKAMNGDLDRIKGCIKITGFVNSTDDFTDQPKVINPASEALSALFGDEGKHSRAAISANSLPLGVAVEIDAIFEI